ncbi:repetitive proline-rich cell wall protein 1-like isoform X2 [Contarinia nasturtii]|uniref:repetitive proline-rich cell wall protein 1-like isoform X2 n=1 Tax=Contarinia nasturtii TaxID=265458 RepID=UPI0012D41F99|nr:repetitive proline-rich cell wall protein 1-like isoform X2 [Contarinia nasturtii]
MKVFVVVFVIFLVACFVEALPTPDGELTNPVGTPPVDTPPVDTPPVDTPPVDTPPVGTPPVDTPPIDTPQVGDLPVDAPPTLEGAPSTLDVGPPNPVQELANPEEILPSPICPPPDGENVPPVSTNNVASSSDLGEKLMEFFQHFILGLSGTQGGTGCTDQPPLTNNVPPQTSGLSDPSAIN